MNHNFEDFITAYQAAPHSLQEVIDSGACGDLAEQVCTQYNKPELKRPLTIAISNYIISLTTVTELRAEITTLGFDPAVTIQISQTVEGFLSQVLQSVSDESLISAGEIAEAEAALSAIPQVRTMPQTPAGSEPVYTSTQAAILSEATPAPTTQPSSTPSWDRAR